MSHFDVIIVVDWSAAARPSPAQPSADAIWVAMARHDRVDTSYHRTRSAAMEMICTAIKTARTHGYRVLVGFDFPLGYPEGFAEAVTGAADPLGLWDWLAGCIEDGDDNANNRFEIAAKLNRAFPDTRPFWGRPATLDLVDLPATKDADYTAFAERRAVEALVPRAQSVWKLYTTGSVGSQCLLGLPRLAALRQHFGSDLAVWPFEAPDKPIVLAEVWPSLLANEVAARQQADDIKDEVQVRVLAERLAASDLSAAFAAPSGPADEGWILGVGTNGPLLQPRLVPPPLRDDCFALPAGVAWLPVDEALSLLKTRLTSLTDSEWVAVTSADGRVLAEDVEARRANPPGANSAVDGFGFAHASIGKSTQSLPLVTGRAAAGAPFAGTIPAGHAVRILTGALVPEGVDTVILEEDTTHDATRIAFRTAPKKGANTRKAGEDLMAGVLALPQAHVLRPPDLALLSAVGLKAVPVRARLRVGVLSTGDELASPGATMDPARTYDANRPMLLAMASRWGHTAVDLGHVGDDRDALAARLSTAKADVIVTSGGASAGDEDHVSAILREAGALTAWRIALKPGRPLALGQWGGKPVFGLPGNPVAAFVCSLIFVRPALSVLAGGTWNTPDGIMLPAAFHKEKKPGRREYLRARIGTNGVEVFASEGSGRISGLSWADGLVELDDGAASITPGALVRYLPYSAFGL